jgi:hypothetical protein
MIGAMDKNQYLQHTEALQRIPTGLNRPLETEKPHTCSTVSFLAFQA